MTDNVHQEEEDSKSTPPNGTESVEELQKAISELFPDDNKEEGEKQFLEQVSKLEGREYKTVEGYAKTVAERNKVVNKHYSDEGRRKKEEDDAKATTTPVKSEDRYAEKLLTIESKEAAYVIDELREVAKDNKIDVLQAWEKFSWIRKEAKTRAEEALEKEKNEGKVKKPSHQISGSGGGGSELTDAERKLLDRVPGRLEKYLKEHK